MVAPQPKSLKWQRRSEARPGEILDAALGLFVDRGFSATKIEDIAEGAGVSKGTVYLYFKSKEDIFKCLVHDIVLPEIERVEQKVSEHVGTQQALLITILKGWQRTMFETRLSGMPKLMMSEASNFPELARYYVENVVHRSIDIVSGVIAAGIQSNEFKRCDPVITARVIMAHLVYLVIWDHSLRTYDANQLDSDNYMQCQIDLILNGLLT